MGGAEPHTVGHLRLPAQRTRAGCNLTSPARNAGGMAALQACANDISSAAFADELRGFEPFAAALDKVRRDGAAVPRCARSLSPLRAAAADASSFGRTKSGSCSWAPRPTPATATQRKASAAVAARHQAPGTRVEPPLCECGIFAATLLASGVDVPELESRRGRTRESGAHTEELKVEDDKFGGPFCIYSCHVAPTSRGMELSGTT